MIHDPLASERIHFGIPFSLSYLWLRWVFLMTCRLSLVAASRGSSLVAVCGLLITAASLVADHRLWGFVALRDVGS